MKIIRKGRLVSLLMMLMMVCGSFGFAFADDAPAETQLGAMTKVKAYPGYNSVTLKWSAVTNAQGYEVCKTNSKGAVKETKNVKNVTEFRDKSAKEANKKYYYKVRAYRTNSDGTKQYTDYSAVVNGKAVRQMYEKIYLSRTRTLTSHGGGSRVTRTFSPNKAITATGFGGGCYKFYDGTGKKRRLFYVSYLSVRSAKADYSKKKNYSTVTAENFANELTKAKVIKKNRKSNYFIWVSTYTQHIYIFKWNKKQQQWKLFKCKIKGKNRASHWECATGEAVSPTIINMKMAIRKKVAYENGTGIPYWNCFSGWNAIHGKKDSYVIDGQPHSHGCVRNYNYNAEWIYKNCPVGTPVCIY